MKRFLALLAVAALILALGFVFSIKDTAETPEPQQKVTPMLVRSLMLGGRSVEVEVADTPSLRERGLSGGEALLEGTGMLFVFAEEGLHSFWMKDMRFSIDILWLTSSGEIIHMEESVSPSTYPTTFLSQKPSTYVLELPAGYASVNGIRLGDRVTF